MRTAQYAKRRPARQEAASTPRGSEPAAAAHWPRLAVAAPGQSPQNKSRLVAVPQWLQAHQCPGDRAQGSMHAVPGAISRGPAGGRCRCTIQGPCSVRILWQQQVQMHHHSLQGWCRRTGAASGYSCRPCSSRTAAQRRVHTPAGRKHRPPRAGGLQQPCAPGSGVCGLSQVCSTPGRPHDSGLPCRGQRGPMTSCAGTCPQTLARVVQRHLY
jgi:hypothetical protein